MLHYYCYTSIPRVKVVCGATSSLATIGDVRSMTHGVVHHRQTGVVGISTLTDPWSAGVAAVVAVLRSLYMKKLLIVIVCVLAVGCVSENQKQEEKELIALWASGGVHISARQAREAVKAEMEQERAADQAEAEQE